VATVRVNGTLLKGLGTYEIGSHVFVCIRAEDVVVEQGGTLTSARNHLAGKVRAIDPHGVMVHLQIDCGFPLVATVTRGAQEELQLQPGTPVVAVIKAGAVHLVPRAVNAR
jgi:molybdopterin-binding protein